MVHVALKYGDHLGGPDIITETLKSRELSPTDGKRGSQRFKTLEGYPAALLA